MSLNLDFGSADFQFWIGQQPQQLALSFAAELGRRANPPLAAPAPAPLSDIPGAGAVQHGVASASATGTAAPDVNSGWVTGKQGRLV